MIWRSRDLVNWTPVGPALDKPLGSVWAMDIAKHDGRYFIYIPVLVSPTGRAEGLPFKIYVVHAESMAGPWSQPIDMGIDGHIDPGHAVGEDGLRYLFLNDGHRVRISDDGLRRAGEVEKVYDGWPIPDDWVIEAFAPEGPKILRRGAWFYLFSGQGGTAGPPTSHMVVVARSRSIHGPWENCPHNPIVRTANKAEPWWSRGHATPVEGPAGDWWLVYHGYENGFRTLGRQTLLEPAEWTADGWFRARGGDLSKPLPKPRGGKVSASGRALSDDFSANRFGSQWCFHDPKPDEMSRATYGKKALRIAGRGTSPADSSPLTCGVGDRSYEAEITLELEGKGEGGLLLFYNPKAFIGLGFTPERSRTFAWNEEQPWMSQTVATKRVRIRVTNVENVVTWHTSHDDGKTWALHGLRMEVSGLHHNVFGGFLSLKLAVYSAGDGAVHLSNFTYKALA